MKKAIPLILLAGCNAAPTITTSPLRNAADGEVLVSKALTAVPVTIAEACGRRSITLRVSVQLIPPAEIDEISIIGPDCASAHSDAIMDHFRTAPPDIYRRVSEPTRFEFRLRPAVAHAPF